ncbi:MAG: hypothetical protein M3336_05620, partial [Chloroflexota bacterium]|nr:hypothetical protein [Chloroflexota bacterium]
MSLLRALASLGAVCTLLILPGQAGAQESAIANTPDATVLRAIERQVARQRGLAPSTEIPLRMLDQRSLREYLLAIYDRDYLPNEREADQKLLVALGLLEPWQDLVQLQLELLQGQVIGIYDPDDKVMFVVADAGFGAAQRITYAHEFDHALQDQQFDLNRVAPKHPLSNDRSLAAHAVVEGDAVLLQSLWAAAHLTQDDLLELAGSSSEGDDSLARAPLIVRAELLFPYVEGFSFVRQAYRDAGNSFSAVDELLRNPPESTAQILHPDRFRAGIRPVEVHLPDVSQSLGPDWRRVGSGVLGELDTRVLLEQYGDHAEATRVASGWSGDRWLLLEKQGRSVLALTTAWDSEAAASDFFAAYAQGLRRRFPSAV